MTERDEALREVRQLDYVWIPMRDGARLAARVWLPADAEADPVPAVLEAVPYRLSDGTATRDARVHPYLREGDPLSAKVAVEAESVLLRGVQGRFHIVARGEMTCDADAFYVADEVAVYEGEDGDEREVFTRSWWHQAPRDFV
jgi:hypothetical protein